MCVLWTECYNQHFIIQTYEAESQARLLQRTPILFRSSASMGPGLKTLTTDAEEFFPEGGSEPWKWPKKHFLTKTIFSQIGLMRGGRFLAEESPQTLIRRYQAESLEDVFLKLSVMQNLGKRRRSSILADVVERVELPAIPVSLLLGQHWRRRLFLFLPSTQVISDLC